MVVAGADEGIDGDNAVAARTVLDHHGLTPACGELFGDQARADVGARAGPSVRMNLTGRCGQVCAAIGAADNTSVRRAAATTPAIVLMFHDLLQGPHTGDGR